MNVECFLQGGVLPSVAKRTHHWKSCFTNWICLSDMLMNRTPIPRLMTFSSDIFAFDHATCAVANTGSFPGPIMIMRKISCNCNGSLQQINAPPRLIFFTSAAIFPKVVSIETGQLTSALGYLRFSSPPFWRNFTDARVSLSERLLVFQKYLTIQTTKIAKKNAVPA